MITSAFLNELITLHVSDGVVITDDKGLVEWVNDSFVELTGYSLGEMKGKKPGDILQGPRTHSRSKKALSDAIKKRQPCCIDIFNYKKSGSEYIVQIRLFPLVDESQKLTKFVSIQKEVTLERLLKQQSIEFGAYQQALDKQAIVSVTDTQGNIRHANEKFCEISGYSLDELIGKNHRLINSRTHPRSFFENMWNAIATGGKWQGNVCNRRKTGELYWVDTTVVPVQSPDGEILRYVSIRYDITEKIRSEEQIKYLEARNQALLDFSPVSHKIIDLDFKLRYMNANGFKMLSIPISNDWYGKQYPFSFFQESAKELMLEKLSIVKVTKEKLSFESIALDINNNEVWLYHTLVPVPKDDGSLDYITVVSADITSQKETQEQLRQRERMDAIGELAGGVAHDFNNQLASIMGYTQLAERANVDDKVRSYLSKILSASERSRDLTKQLLTFSRKQELKTECFDVHSQVQETLDLLMHVMDKRIGLIADLKALKSIIEADKSSIQNALLNLCINACHAMERGGELRISTRNVDREDDFLCQQSVDHSLGFIRIDVQDEGCGISDKHLDKIFEPFYTTKPLGQGTGMGLSSVYGTVKQHNGYINVETEIDKGTTFSLYFKSFEDVPSINATKVQELSPKLRTENYRILVADDEEFLRELYKEILSSVGYQVSTVCNGLEAIELFRHNKDYIDLIILDLSMPVMGGAEAIKELRAIDSNIKILLASGYDKNEYDPSKSYDQSVVNGFIEKPFNVKTLLDTLESVFV